MFGLTQSDGGVCSTTRESTCLRPRLPYAVTKQRGLDSEAELDSEAHGFSSFAQFYRGIVVHGNDRFALQEKKQPKRGLAGGGRGLVRRVESEWFNPTEGQHALK